MRNARETRLILAHLLHHLDVCTTYGSSPGFEEQDCHLTQIEVNEMLGLVSHIRTDWWRWDRKKRGRSQQIEH